MSKETLLKIIAFAKDFLVNVEGVIESSDSNDETPEDKPAKKGRRAKAPEPELDPVTESDGDLDDVFGADEEEEEETPKVKVDDIRKLLVSIVKSKGEDGKKKAGAVILKYTKKKTPEVKDLKEADFQKVYNDLKKI